MKVALDIDDTITRHPAFFAFLSKALLDAGHEVVILTFREDRTSTAADLAGWGVVYTDLITSTLDAHLEHGVNEWKGAMCQQHGIDLFFEDSMEVLQHVPEPTVCFAPVGPW